MLQSLAALMFFEAATFLTSAAIHAGLLFPGHEHREARIAETVIAGVLIAGAAMAMNPRYARRAALAAQGFALVGTLVGITTILIGVGPQGPLELVYHFSIVAVLAFGLFAAKRARALPF